MLILRRILVASPEFQASLIVTANLAQLFNIFTITPEQTNGLNIALVTWFGLASKVAFGRAIDKLSETD